MDEANVMKALRSCLAKADVHLELSDLAIRLLDDLRSGHSKSAFRAVPLPLYGKGLPSSIGSSWLFALRSDLNHPPERHPNSIQRMFALDHAGRFEWWDQGKWQSALLLPGGEGLSIPPETWHRMPAQEADWVVASFHCAAPDELMEIVGDPETGNIASTRRYLAGEMTSASPPG